MTLPPVSSLPGPGSGANLARRSLTSVGWNMVARAIKLPAGLVLSVILARQLSVEYFGIVAGLEAFLSLLSAFFDFGLTGAYYHRSSETEDEERATQVLFTLRVVFSAIWIVLLIPPALLFFSGMRQMVLLVWGVTVALMRVVDVPRLLLMRRVQHKMLAFFDSTAALLVLVISAAIAYISHSIWALLVYPLVSLIWSFLLFYVIHPVWRPRWRWDRAAIRYFLDFGWRGMPGGVLGVALDRVDDLWTNLFLGDLAMGYYSRAYSFAVYPGIVLAEPVNVVASATYAELKHDRPRRSQAFFNVNALLVRSGFLLGGWFAVVAPELIRIFLGERWLPMVMAFRLMLLFTLFNPLKVTVASLLVAMGKPEQVSLVRFIQLLVMLAGLFGLGFRYNIEGVALAVDGMLLVGMILVFILVRPHVDISYRQLLLVPAIGLLVGIGLSWWVSTAWDLTGSDWLALALKTLAFGLGSVGVLLALDRRLIFALIRDMLRLAKNTGPEQSKR
jgi:O-antigen/teichoic acid export membrane protein